MYRNEYTEWLVNLEGLFFLETGSDLCTSKIDINSEYYDAGYESSVRNPKFGAIYNLHEMLLIMDQNAATALSEIYDIEQDLLSSELYRKVLFIGYDPVIHNKILRAIECLEGNIELLWDQCNNLKIINFNVKYKYDSVSSFWNDVYEILLSLKSIETQLSSLNNHTNLTVYEKSAQTL